MTTRKIGLALILWLGLTSLSGCTFDRIVAHQMSATGLWEELIGGHSFGQTFMCDRDGLYRIDLGTATYARTNLAPVIFRLRASPEADIDLRVVILPASDIQNDRPTSIEFAPLPDSQGKTYYYQLESPESTPGNAITVYASEYDVYPGGTAYRQGEPVTGDLVFTAYSRETFAFGVVLHEFWSRVTHDLPFFVCYGGLVLAVLVVFAAALKIR